MQFELLAYIAAYPNRVFTREQLIENVWGYESSGYQDNVSTFVRHIRERIEDEPSDPKYVLTVRGVGYKFMGK